MKKKNHQEMVKVPIIRQHHPELIKGTGEGGSVVYTHPNTGVEWDVCTTLSFCDIRVRCMGLLRETLQSLNDDLYLSGLGAAIEQLVNFTDQRFEEVEYLLDEHVGKLEFHQIYRSECYGGNCIIGLTVTPKASEGIKEGGAS